MPDTTIIDVDSYFAFVERNAFIPEPPQERIYIGDGAFRQIGCAVVKTLIKRLGLKPTDEVIDIGSGIGRVALPLTQWLNGEGRYLGIEIVTEGVSWCIETITSRYPNFRFLHADLQNDYYNPHGQGSSAQFHLREDPASFDIAIFASVFTHLAADDADAWLGHVSRVLRPGGKVWASWFIMTEETQENCRIGRSTIGLGYQEDGVFWQTPEKNPGAVGYSVDKMREMFSRHGFTVESQALGSWCTRGLMNAGYQDETVLAKA